MKIVGTEVTENKTPPKISAFTIVGSLFCLFSIRQDHTTVAITNYHGTKQAFYKYFGSCLLLWSVPGKLLAISAGVCKHRRNRINSNSSPHMNEHLHDFVDVW